MALDTESVRFLLASRRSGAGFRRCMTLGRQSLMVGKNEMAMLLREYDYNPEDYPELLAAEYSRLRWSEDFWKVLGTEELCTMDASDFEGATVVHDLNEPIPGDLKQRFDAVCDIGTLEHIFNFPQALRNCLEMVALGGHIFLHTPANNLFGHGFYQFSPELFSCVLSAENGFKLEKIVAVEHGPRHRWFEVADPMVTRSIGKLTNVFPVALYIRAQRTAIVPVLSKAPNQSAFVAQWSGDASPEQKGVVDRFSRGGWVNFNKRLIEAAPRLARFLEGFRYSPLNREWSFRNRRAFKRLHSKRG